MTKKRIVFLFLNFLIFYFRAQNFSVTTTFPKQKVTDTLWGRLVEDPYRGLEKIDSKETVDWLKEQEKIKTKYEGDVNGLSEYLDLYSRIHFQPLFKRGAYFFSYRTDKENASPCLYYQKNDEDEKKFLFDPNIFADGDNTVSIDEIELSSNDSLLALTLERNGSDWKEIRFLSMDRKRLLTDNIKFVKYNKVCWYKNGVFYMRYNVSDTRESMEGLIKEPAVYYHKIGTSQSEDVLVFKQKKEYDYFQFYRTAEGKYLVLDYVDNQNKSFHKLSLIPLTSANTSFEKKEFIQTKNLRTQFKIIGELNGKLLVQSDLNAPKGAIYQADLKTGNSLSPFIPAYSEQLLSVNLFNRKIVADYSNDKQASVLVRDSTGKTVALWDLPEGYKLAHLTGSLNDSIAIYSFNSFFSPSSVYKINLNSFERQPLSKTLTRFNNTGIITEKVYYYSKDSTKVPMYLTYKTGLKLDGNNPVILYGYGGFGISMEPFFEVAHVIFFRNGGVLATPGIRGGGEFPGWHQKGTGLNKQNTFDDFIAAAEYLITNKYTNPNKLASMGGSNGGLLVGATMIQRPELFKVAVSLSGALDMIRFHYYNIGYAYANEFGSIKDSLEFENLLRYSPVHNVKKGIHYPATLLVASDSDDRVNPFNSFKFIAELQAKGTGSNPYILYYQRNAGHSGSSTFDKRIQQDAYVYAFIFKYLGIADKMNYGK